MHVVLSCCAVVVRNPCLLFVGSEQQSKHSGPYKFKPLTLDLSVTSAYQPATPVSITQLPNSPLYLHRTTSHKNPPRPSLTADNAPASRTRTLSTSSSTAGVNGRRPVPAPRMSIGSRADLEYHAVDSSMPDVQISNGIPSASSTTGQSFLYPEISSHPKTKETGFSRASTLPVSAQRPQLDAPLPTRSRSKSPDGRDSKGQGLNGSQCDTESANTSLGSSTLDNKSSRNSSRRGAANQNMKRINSRTSLTDLEKSERRKSDLLESSPYPQLYNLALEDEDSDNSSSVTKPVTNTISADPIYTQINKGATSRAQSTRGGDGMPRTNNTSNSSGSHANHNAQDTSNNSVGAGSHIVSNKPLHATVPTSPIYEQIDAVSSIPPNHWQVHRGAQSNNVDFSSGILT